MHMVTCPFCSGPHPLWECRKKPDGWKPPKHAPIQKLERITVVEQRDDGGLVVHPAIQTVRKPRGRPPTGFDKKAYDAERMRKARAALKAKRNG